MRKLVTFLLAVVAVVLLYVLLPTHVRIGPVADHIHRNAVVVDSHCDTLIRIIDANADVVVDLGSTTALAIDVLKMRKGGVDVQFFAAFSAERYRGEKTLSHLLALVTAFYHTTERSGSLRRVSSMAELRDALSKKQIAAVLALEGADVIRPPHGIELLRQLYDLGVRSIGLTWNDSNALAEGILRQYPDGSPSDGGITDYGREVIREMNWLGILVDLAHASERSSHEIALASADPVFASHAATIAISGHRRNLTDEQIRLISNKGGTTNIMFGTAFLSPHQAAADTRVIVDHIDHVVRLVGPSHVGLGSDFDGTAVPPDMRDASMLPRLTQELLTRGYSEDSIRRVLGDNMLRLMERVWKPPTLEPAGPQVNLPTPVGTRVARRGSIVEAQVEPGPVLCVSFLNGAPTACEHTQETGAVTIRLPPEMPPGFHVLTLQATGQSGRVTRKTTIIRAV